MAEAYGTAVCTNCRTANRSFLWQHSKFHRDGFYVMDEPEAALSPQRQLSLLVILHD